MGTVLRQAFIMASKDTRVFFKDKFAVFFSFLMPFMFVIGFSLALANVGEVEDEPLEFVVASQEPQADSSVSRWIIQGLADGEAPVVAMEYDEALALVEAGEIPGFVSFPARFSEDWSHPRPTALEVAVSAVAEPAEVAALQGFARSLVAGMGTAGALEDILNELDPDALSGRWLATDPGMVVSFDTERVGDVEPINATDFVLPGYLTMFVFFAAALGAEAIARERQGRTLERLLANGARRGAIILGKFGGAAFRGRLAACGYVDGWRSGVRDRLGGVAVGGGSDFCIDGPGVGGVRGDAVGIRERCADGVDGGGSGVADSGAAGGLLVAAVHHAGLDAVAG